MSVLVVVAHADDEVLGCGGTLLQMKDDKKHIMVMTDGISSRVPAPKREAVSANTYWLKAYKERRDIFERVCEHIGAGDNYCYVGRREDNSMDTLPLLRVAKWIERYIEETKPTTILTHYEHDLNIDHRITYQAVVTACRPFKYPSVKQIYSFEVPSSTELASVPFQPDTFVDIGDTILRKVQLFNTYKEDSPARNTSVIESLTRYRGTQAGCTYAEAFKTVRRIGL